jgi:hypothetical protein
MSRLTPLLTVALLLTSSLTSTLHAGVEEWTKDKVNAEIAKHAKDVHHLTLRANSGGATVLLAGRIDQTKKDEFDVIFHAKVDAAGIRDGDAVLAYRATPPGRRSKLPTVRSTILFHLRREMPRKAGEATDLFDELMGEGARGGIYGGRHFTRGDDGNWVIYGNFDEPGQDFKVKAVTIMGPDDDDARILVITMFAEVDTGKGQ